MESGKVYVVHNEWIQDPETGEMPYKIGITSDTVEKRFYGLGLKMPGEFICDFAYEFGETYTKVEKTLHSMLNQLNLNGEWFSINEEALDGIRTICEMAGGVLITEKIEEEIESDTEETMNPILENIIEKWNKISKYKTSGKSFKGRSIRLDNINGGLHYTFRIQNSKEIQLSLGCYTKEYPNMDKTLIKFDGMEINGHIFKYRPPINKKEINNGWKGKIYSILSFNNIENVLSTMEKLIEMTIEKITDATKE